MTKCYGPVYALRNIEFAMDDQMAKILRDLDIFGEEGSYQDGFVEGLKCGRIWPCSDLTDIEPRAALLLLQLMPLPERLEGE
jgi:hypothetical protein